MFNIDPNIPLQAKERDYGRGFDNMQTYQANALKLQQLRDAYDAEKADRLRQKQMRSGIQTDIEQIQRGIPAKYSPLQYQQTPQRGQMPYGMTGVLANERGQNMPQPKVFGEDVLSGNFNLSGGDVTQQAQEGRQPTPEEYVQILAKQAMMYGDEKTGFEALKLAAELKKNPNKYFGGLTKAIDPKTNKPLFLAMTETGAVPVDEYQPYEEPEKVNLKQQQFQREQQAALFEQQRQLAEFNAKKQREIALLKPDPVEKALEIERGKEKIKQESTTKAAQREKLANANDGLPLLDNYINALKESPQSGAGELYQKGMGFIGNPLFLGDEKKQGAMARAKQAGEALLTFAQKQPGPSTDRDVASYRAQMGVVTDSSLPAQARIAAAEQAKALLLKIQQKYGNYAESGKTDKSADYMEYKKERDAAYKLGKYDLVRKLDAIAKQDGLTK